MVEYRSTLLDRTFGALADPTRRRILAQLAKGDECVTDLARPHAMSLAAVSKHLTVLKRAKLVRDRRHGRETHYSAQPKALAPMVDWLNFYGVFWREKFDRLEAVLERMEP